MRMNHELLVLMGMELQSQICSRCTKLVFEPIDPSSRLKLSTLGEAFQGKVVAVAYNHDVFEGENIAFKMSQLPC